MTKQEGIRRVATASICIIVAGLAAFLFFYKDEQGLEVSFLNVGQGDAALIQTPHKKTILVDAGPIDKAIMRRLGEELPFWDHTIDMVIITHPHDDHFGGLFSIIDRYTIKACMLSDVEDHSPAYLSLIKTLRAKNIPLIYARKEAIAIDEVQFDFIFPDHSLSKEKIKNANNASIVFKLSYGTIDILFTGDAESEVEGKLVKESKDKLAVEVLKLGHHGSDTSSSESFLEATKPKLAIVSVGKDNDFGHPSPLIIKRLERRGIQFFRTDTEGTIKLLSDGTSLFRGNTCLIGCS